MAIVGLGTDFVSVVRIERALQRHGHHFVERILSPAECEQFEQRHRRAVFLSSRFAAKEAAAKALGTGIAQGIGFTDMEVKNLTSGQPTLIFHGAAAEHAKRLGVTHRWLSLTDERDHALAVVVLEANS